MYEVRTAIEFGVCVCVLCPCSQLVTLLSCFIVALFVTNLGVLFELIGSISAVSLAYILPPLCFLSLEGGRWYSPKKLLALAVLGFGLFCMIGGTGKIILGLFQGKG